MKKIILVLIWLVFLGVVKAYYNTPLRAQNSAQLDLSISPPIAYLSVKPGEKIAHKIILKNNSLNSYKITPKIQDFRPDGETNLVILEETSNFRYLDFTDRDISFGQEFVLHPKQSKQIPIRISIPESVTEGEHSFSILFAAEPDTSYQISQSGSKISGVIGSNLIVLISKSDLDQAQIDVAHIQTPLLIDSLMPINFKILAHNTGSNASIASGSAQILDFKNQILAEFEFYPDMILAQSSRYLRTKEFLSYNFKLKKPFLIGPYKIKVQLQSNSQANSEIMIYSQTILALPLVILLLPIAFFGLYFGYKTLSLKFFSYDQKK